MPEQADKPDTPNTRSTHRVSVEDLPLHCPLPGSSLWNSHPKVYLPIEKAKKINCPYCGTLFVLEEEPEDPAEEETDSVL